MTLISRLLPTRPAVAGFPAWGAPLICLILASPLVSCAGSDSLRAGPAPLVQASISHDVFFTFTDPSDADVQGLIAACETLRRIPGVVHLTAGPRDGAQVRDVNEQSFHVALHVEFADQRAYDGYGPHPVHQALVTEFVPKTSAVVVYDALIGGK